MNIEKKPTQPNLFICVLLDLVGMLSYLIPALAEFSDVYWAPVSAFIFYMMFGGRVGKIGAVLNFLEEIFPFTDFIPTFTIAWFFRKQEMDNNNKLSN